MKLKIKVKLFEGASLPQIINKGEWVDLRANDNIDIKAPQAEVLKKRVRDGQVVERYRNVVFTNRLVPLGVAMKLPKGFEAHMLPRSGTFGNFGITMANSQGIIDNSYSGNCDEWKFNAIAFKDVHIEAGDRICQFRIELSQKATVWQKLKWLFSSGIEFVQVDSLDATNRGGFSSTGVK